MSFEQYEFFKVSINNKVAEIELSRPEAMNAMNKAFWNDLPRLVRDIDREALARVIVISAAGKHFTAGMDLGIFASGAAEMEQYDQYVQAEAFYSNLKLIQGAFNALEEARMPVLVACHGAVIGGGVDMVCAGDIRWCTSDAYFSIHETNIAMMADVGTFPRLQRYVGEGWVKQMAYTGEPINAEQALKIGLVNEVFEDKAAMLEHVRKVAATIAQKDPLVVTGCKTLINYGRDHSTADTLQFAGAWNAGMLPATHMQEAFVAKAEQREPQYPDLAKLRDSAF